jgi:hypothetical protein
LALKVYPFETASIKLKVKEEFFKNKYLQELEIKKAVGKGRYQVRELNAISKFHKYRKMRERYDVVK